MPFLQIACKPIDIAPQCRTHVAGMPIMTNAVHQQDPGIKSDKPSNHYHDAFPRACQANIERSLMRWQGIEDRDYHTMMAFAPPLRQTWTKFSESIGKKFLKKINILDLLETTTTEKKNMRNTPSITG
jgi:hypothetical protein